MKNAIYNPHNKDEDELPTIFGFNNNIGSYYQQGVLLSEDGFYLGGHSCTNESYMIGDLGVVEGSSPDRHKNQFKPHYPDGYKMEFVSYDDVEGNEKLMKAIEIEIEHKHSEKNW